MNHRINADLIKNRVLYYLMEQDSSKRHDYEVVIKNAIQSIIGDAFGKEVIVMIEERDTENVNLPDVLVIGVHTTRKVNNILQYDHKNGDMLKASPRVFLVSFSSRARTMDAETLTALLLYQLCNYFTTNVNIRVARALHLIAGSLNLPILHPTINQISGVLFYVYGIAPFYLVPTPNRNEHAVIDMFTNMWPNYSKPYILYVKKQLNIPNAVKVEEYADNYDEKLVYQYCYMDDIDSINDDTISFMMKHDKKDAMIVARHADKGILDNYLEDLHAQTGIKLELKTLLDFQTNSAKPVNETVILGSPISEAIFGPRSESEFRYKLNKIIVASKYIDTESERTALLVDVYNLKLKLIKYIEKEEGKLDSFKTKKENVDQIAIVEFCKNMLDELVSIETTIVNADIKPKKFGVFIEYPAGYNY